jgi:hypothetical protein
MTKLIGDYRDYAEGLRDDDDRTDVGENEFTNPNLSVAAK